LNGTNYYEVKVDGTIYCTATSGDTAYVTEEDVTGVVLQGSGDTGSGTSALFDSVLIWDTTGSAPFNDSLGTTRWWTQTLRPNGNGSTNNFLGSDSNSTDNYLLVDDTTADGDTTYSQSQATSDIDLYDFDNLPAICDNVLACNSVAIWKKTTADALTSRQLTRISSTNYEGDNISPTTGYTWNQRIMVNSPATSSAWGNSEVDGAQFGVKDHA
jgi:FlaG/FlaF family flagellin (archaellin)